MRINPKIREIVEKAITDNLVRCCVVCSRPFFVKRFATSMCCSECCRKTWNQRRHRERLSI
jgi:hypothetical protein